MTTQQKIELLGKINRLREELDACFDLTIAWPMSEHNIALSVSYGEISLERAIELIKERSAQ